MYNHLKALLYCAVLLACMPGGGSAANITFPVPDSTLAPDIFGQPQSLFPGTNTNLSGNSVTVNDGTIPNNVFGAMSNTAANVFSNTVLINGGVAGTGAAYSLPPALLTNSTILLQQDGYPLATALVGGAVFGGVTYQGDSYSNTVTVAGGTVQGTVYGGFVMDGGGNAYGNKVNLTGGTVDIDVVGGFVSKGAAHDNQVTVSGGSVGNWVIGGLAHTDGDALNNTVTINGGTFLNPNRRIVAGFAQDGNANGNKVIVTGLADPAALANMTLHGGDSITGSTNYNSVTIYNVPGIQLLGITGGIAGGISGPGGTSIGNVVSIINSPGFSMARPIWGGRFGDDTGMNQDNTLNLYNSGGSTQGIYYFENYNFYLPNTLQPGQPLVTITGGTPVDMTGTNVNITGIAPGGTLLQPGDTLTLFSKADGLTEFHATVPKGGVLLYDFRVFTDGALKAELASASLNPDSGIVPHGHAAAAAFLAQGADLIADFGGIQFLEPEERRKMPTIFAVATGGEMRYNVGSHVDVKGVSFLLGTDWGLASRWGALNFAAFFEMGHGKYDSYHDSWRYFTMHADGNTRYYGGGLLGRLDFMNGLYVEASGRAGGTHADFSSHDIDFLGHEASYDYSTPYFGAHGGLGYIWQMARKVSLDAYAKYLWVRVNSHDVTVLGDPIHFKADDSQRGRLGARVNYAATSCLTAYAGAAYEYEFSGEASAVSYGFDLVEPSVKGGSGVGELGFFYRAGAMTVELGAKGYVGKREGVTGRCMIGYDF